MLWLPIEDDKNIPLSQRRIGLGFLWQPSQAEENILQNDWQALSNLIVMGNIEQVSAHLGEALQIRPKAAHGKALTNVRSANGTVVKTLPRGFYLRASFTFKIFQASFKG